MREILFRGKTESGAWVEGAYYKQTEFYGDKCEEHYIITSSCAIENDLGLEYYEVIPETIGQYTGLKDKNGKRVFEGDVVILTFSSSKCYGEVVFYNGGFCVNTLGTFVSLQKCLAYEFELIGNVHDTPELKHKRREGGRRGMSRYINLDTVIERLENDLKTGDERVPISWVKGWLETQEKADVVEVVRCKDCIFASVEDGKIKCYNTYGLLVTKETEYCNRGRRSENGT